MTYAAFILNTDDRHLFENGLCLISLTAPDDLIFHYPKKQSLKSISLSSLNITDLFLYVLQLLYSTNEVCLVKYKSFLPNDDLFLPLNNQYIGYVDNIPSRFELTNHAIRLSKLGSKERIITALKSQFNLLNFHFPEAELSAKEIFELRCLFDESIKPIETWLDDRRNSLLDDYKAELKPLLKRGASNIITK